MGEKKKESNFLVQGSILAIAGVLTKIIGLIYRIPLLNIVGNEGMGYYNVAFTIYTLALMLTSYSLPLAVSKLISERIALGQYRNANKVYKEAMKFAIISGGIFALVIYVGANFIAGKLMTMEMSAYALRVLAPCILIVALLGVLRGFFQGMGSMIPTAISQIIEQIVNAFVSVAGAYFLLQEGKKLAETKGIESIGPAYAAAGGTLGTTSGAFASLVFVFLLYLVYRKKFNKKIKKDHSGVRESNKKIYRVLFATIAPVILSATVYNIGDFLDSAIFNKISEMQGVEETVYASLLGMFGGQYSTLTNVPISVSSALAASLIPSLVMTATTGTRKQVHSKISLVTRFNMIIAIPCAAGFLILAKPILDLLFYTQDNTIAAYMLQIGSLSVVFYCLSTVTNAVIQGLDDMMTPVKNAAISLVIHIVSLLIMMVVLHWSIYAVVISKIIFAGANCILNANTLRQSVGYVTEKKRTYIIPTLAAAIMAAVTMLVHVALEIFVGSKLATIVSILVAVAAYGISLLALGGVTEEELLEMPKGASIVRLLKKLHLIRG